METTHTTEALSPLSAARFIKVIGRGKDGARSMSRDDAELLYKAMLEERVTDLELGAILLSMRIKGESVDEIAGFLAAGESSFEKLSASSSIYAPVVIPTYNGSRHMANLTPLLALLLAREGVPVLVHGVEHDPGRVTTAEIFQALGFMPSQTVAQSEAHFARNEPAFMPIEALAPQMARLLSLRRVLGVRSSTHTLVKIMQPFAQPALRLSSYTHPEYLEMLTAYFTTASPPERGDAFLMRGTEGETVANAKRAQQIDWFHEGQCTTVVQAQAGIVGDMPVLPEGSDPASTAVWIQGALAGSIPVPATIARQVEQCLLVSRELHSRHQHHAHSSHTR